MCSRIALLRGDQEAVEFSGGLYAQSLRAAQQTVRGGFVVLSLHGSFVFAGNPEDSTFYHVQRVRDGKGFCTRSVRAVQGGRPIFIRIINFTTGGSSGKDVKHLQHGPPMPSPIPEPQDTQPGCEQSDIPYINSSIGICDNNGKCRPENKRKHQWIRACGALSPSAGSQAHQAALAFMSDSYFLVGVPHTHEI
ncbi:thioesterase-like superfamily-domain-containing protein [Aspergillus spectabilis]